MIKVYETFGFGVWISRNVFDFTWGQACCFFYQPVIIALVDMMASRLLDYSYHLSWLSPLSLKIYELGQSRVCSLGTRSITDKLQCFILVHVHLCLLIILIHLCLPIYCKFQTDETASLLPHRFWFPAIISARNCTGCLWDIHHQHHERLILAWSNANFFCLNAEIAEM